MSCLYLRSTEVCRLKTPESNMMNECIYIKPHLTFSVFTKNRRRQKKEKKKKKIQMLAYLQHLQRWAIKLKPLLVLCLMNCVSTSLWKQPQPIIFDCVSFKNTWNSTYTALYSRKLIRVLCIWYIIQIYRLCSLKYGYTGDTFFQPS